MRSHRGKKALVLALALLAALFITLLTACDRMIRRFEELEGLPGDRKDAGKAFRDWLQ